MKNNKVGQTLFVRPMTVNQVWQGRRFKTPKYKTYEKYCLLKLKPAAAPVGRLMVILTFGVSSKLADIDNPVKPFLDILQKKYGFDDKQVYELIVYKMDVKKGAEFVTFIIREIE